MWTQLPKPIFTLAPMADVTDSAFRQIIARYGKPDVMFTEFLPCDALCSAEGRKNLAKDLLFTESERPLVLQIFGAKPDHFTRCAEMAQELGYDGIDINMGCPEKNIQKQGACAALIKNPALAQEIIRATKKGAGSLPVSVKTRIGYTKNTLEEWILQLLETEPAAITVHGRTKKEMSDVPADWSAIKCAKEIVVAEKSSTLILGNGDIASLAQADERIAQTGVDGIMVGRGIFGNPWFFNRAVSAVTLPLTERFRVMLEHTFLFEELFGGSEGRYKNFAIMKKHFKAYVSGFDGAKELRVKLMEAATAQEVKEVIENYVQQL